jgi:hypothetical protein
MGFLWPPGAIPGGQLDAADLGEQDARLPQRHGFPVPVLHLVHELEHVAARVAAEAVVDPPLEVHRAAGLHVVVEGARDFHLIALAPRREAVVVEDGAEVRALAEIHEVDTPVVRHGVAAI